MLGCWLFLETKFKITKKNIRIDFFFIFLRVLKTKYLNPKKFKLNIFKFIQMQNFKSLKNKYFNLKKFKN
jgi:hypothetical protein